MDIKQTADLVDTAGINTTEIFSAIRNDDSQETSGTVAIDVPAFFDFRDSYTKSETEYDTFSTYTKPVSGKKRIFLGDDFNYREVANIVSYLRKSVSDYVSGSIGNEDIADTVKRMYRDTLSVNIAMGKTDGLDANFNEQTLYDVQRNFIMRTLQELYVMNQSEGHAYAMNEEGKTPGRDYYAYYNADYYYFNRELQDICNDTVTKIAKDEGFSNFRISEFYETISPYSYDFNFMWSNEASLNLHCAKLKNYTVPPTRGFVMYYAANRYSRDAQENGTMYNICANVPNATYGFTGHDIILRVPKGASLAKENANPLLLSLLNNKFHRVQDGAFVLDISKFFKSGVTFNNDLREFFSMNINTFLNGELILWHNKEPIAYDVPFNIFSPDKKQFSGNEIVGSSVYSGWLANIELFQYI